MNGYPKGSLIKITFMITNTDTGALVDPAVVTVKIESPSGALTTYVFGVDAEMVRDGVGTYHFYITLSESGNWFYRAEGTGTNVSANEDTILALPSSI